MNNVLTIGVYPKGGKRASVVFRKNRNILYRITTLERADLFVCDMYHYTVDLSKKREEPEFLVELHSTRKRCHALEIALADDRNAELRVYEMIDGCAKLCFKWKGLRDELSACLQDFGIMMIAFRF